MQDPKKPDDHEPERKLEEGLRGLDLDKFGNATQKLLRDLTQKGKSNLEHAKDALSGNEEAKEELANRAASAWQKLRNVKKTAGEVIDKTAKKISDAKNRPPAP